MWINLRKGLSDKILYDLSISFAITKLVRGEVLVEPISLNVGKKKSLRRKVWVVRKGVIALRLSKVMLSGWSYSRNGYARRNVRWENVKYDLIGVSV